MEKRLPDLPSELIRLALSDLEQVEKNQNYQIDMSEWHRPGLYVNPKCKVCLAGAVIARTLSVRCDRFADPQNFDLDTANKLRALEDFRSGSVGDGFFHLGLDWRTGARWDRKICFYHIDRDRFFNDMDFLYEDLKNAGF